MLAADAVYLRDPLAPSFDAARYSPLKLACLMDLLHLTDVAVETLAHLATAAARPADGAAAAIAEVLQAYLVQAMGDTRAQETPLWQRLVATSAPALDMHEL